MRTAYWDSNDPEMYWDNPNLRWGSPSYLLEKGDEGYVDPFPSVNQTKKKTKTMKHQDYYPNRVSDQIIWLLNFAGILPSKATGLGLTTVQVNALVADCLWLAYVLQNWLESVRSFSLGCTQTSIAAQTGTGTSAVALDTFTAPALPTGVVAQLPGSLTRIFAAVQQIKAGGKSNDAINAELRIVGSAQAAPDFTLLQPVITVLVLNGHVQVKWGWQGFATYLDSCEIWVDRGDGKGFVFLTIDTTPNYTDTQSLPVAPAKWTYKAVYRQGETQVGLWSLPVGLTVGA